MPSLTERLFHRRTFSLHYIPEVDGIRFVAIAMVFLHHTFTVFSTIFGAEPSPGPVTDVVVNNGFKGIHIFFVLSGFILALPFIKWRNGSRGRVGMKDYYGRRLTRLEPPYLISLLICLWLAWDSSPGTELWKHFFASVFYCHNIIYGRQGAVNGVTWTLEIEAQFYLIAPLLFQVFRLSKKLRRGVLVLAAALFCIAQYFYAPATLTLYLYISCFLLGMLLADYYEDGVLKWLNNVWIILPALLLFAAIWYLPMNHSRLANLPFPFVVAAFLLCIFNNGLLRKIFSLKWLTLIGGMCYSIYLLHSPLLYMIGNVTKHLRHGDNYWKNFAVQVPLYAAGVLVICSAYFLIVEKPFMRLRRPGKAV